VHTKGLRQERERNVKENERHHADADTEDKEARNEMKGGQSKKTK